MNNANYIRYAESARVNWILHFAAVDPKNGAKWRELMTPKGTGLIMKSIKAEYKFVRSLPSLHTQVLTPITLFRLLLCSQSPYVSRSPLGKSRKVLIIISP